MTTGNHNPEYKLDFDCLAYTTVGSRAWWNNLNALRILLKDKINNKTNM